MKKILIAACAVMILISLCFVSYAQGTADDLKSNEEVVIYVSPDGDDAGDGSPENMLKTPAGAQQFLRKSGLLRKKPIRVVFKEGDYYIDKGAVFYKEDAGSEECPVIWQAEKKGTVRFLGSTVLDNSRFTKVTDEAVLERIPIEARDKVVQLDLAAHGIHIDEEQVHLWSGTWKQPYTDLVVNNKMQMLSRWPNGRNNYALWDSVLIRGSSGWGKRGVEYGAKLKFDNPRLARWVGVKNAYITGHVANTFSIASLEIHSVNPEDGTIQLMSSAGYPPSAGAPKNFQIFNLLEELDIPTEWYIDAATQTLYYYPPSDITEDDVFELITMNETMFEMKEKVPMHYTFKDFDFSRSRKCMMNLEGDDVTVDGCTFTYCKDYTAIRMAGVRFVVENCVFAHLDGRAITVSTGQGMLGKSVREYSEIRNNYVYDAGDKVTSMAHSFLSYEAPCINIKNNTIHYVPQGVFYYGKYNCDLNVTNNEFYNFGMNLSDVGGVYTGYTGNEMGNNISYNYFYDYGSKNPYIGGAVQGVYFDDGALYGNAHHNIFINGSHSSVQIGGGKYNNASSNIIINMGIRAMETDHRVETWSNGETIAKDTHSQSASRLKSTPRFTKIYPWVNHIEESGRREPYGNIIRNNISDMPFKLDARMIELGTVENNYQVSDYSHFVDPENYDFRIKDSSIFAKVIPELTESRFNLETDVGCALDVTENIDRSFSLLAPANGIKYDANSGSFVWEAATMADNYVIKIATDKEMKNIVHEETVWFPSCEVEGLENGKEYWWSVEAHNTSFRRKTVWTAGPTSFINTSSEMQKLTDILYYISGCEYTLNTEDLTMYQDNADEALRTVCEDARKFYNTAMVRKDVTAEEIDAQIKKLEKARADFLKAEKLSYKTLDTNVLQNPDAWYLNGHKAEVEGDQVKFSWVKDATTSTQVVLKEQPDVNDVMTVRAKIDYTIKSEHSSWVSLDVRKNSTDKATYSSHGMMVIIKEKWLELQVYPSPKVVSTIENKWTKDGEWHEFAVGAINKTGYTRYLFMVDGEIVFSYNDYSATLTGPGYFGFTVSERCNLTVAPSQIDYGSVVNDDNLYLAGKTGYSESGDWADSEIAGELNSVVRKSSSNNASATWKIEKMNGSKRIFFNKIVASDGDAKAKLTIHTNLQAGREGDETTKEIVLDLSAGESEWIAIGEGLFSSGDVTVTLTGSGTDGNLYANAVRIEEMED